MSTFETKSAMDAQGVFESETIKSANTQKNSTAVSSEDGHDSRHKTVHLSQAIDSGRITEIRL